MVLIATTRDNHTVAFKVAVPLTADDLDRLRAISELPGMEGATWVGREGESLR